MALKPETDHLSDVSEKKTGLLKLLIEMENDDNLMSKALTDSKEGWRL